jgi:hypothetical protein
MPAVTPAEITLRQELKLSVGDAITLNGTLEAVIAIKVKQPGTFHGKVDFSSPPWYSPVANAVLDLHALSRKLERDIRSELGLPAKARGGSGANTIRALEAISRLCEGADDFTVRLSAREMRKWAGRALGALAVTEMPRRLPRQPGEPERKCPFCKNHTLRSMAAQGKVWCANPGCRDDSGRRPQALLEYFRGELVLRWHDGAIGLP